MAPGRPHFPAPAPSPSIHSTRGRVNVRPAPPRQLPGSLLGFGSGPPTGSHARPSVPFHRTLPSSAPGPAPIPSCPVLPARLGWVVVVAGGGGGVHRVLELDVFAVSDEIKPVQMQRNNIKFLTKASGGSFKMYLDEVQETGKGSSGDSL